MAKGVFLAFSNAANDQVHEEYNEWYDNVHMKEVLALPGVISARRFKLANAQIMPGDDAGDEITSRSMKLKSKIGKTWLEFSSKDSPTETSRSIPIYYNLILWFKPWCSKRLRPRLGVNKLLDLG